MMLVSLGHFIAVFNRLGNNDLGPRLGRLCLSIKLIRVERAMTPCLP